MQLASYQSPRIRRSTQRSYQMTEHDSQSTPTELAPPPSQNDITTHPHASEAPLRDTQPPAADNAKADSFMGTMLPPGTPREIMVNLSDNLLGDLIARVSEAARVMSEERAERAAYSEASIGNQRLLIDQQTRILESIERSAAAGEANHKILKSAYDRLEAGQHSHEKQIEHLRVELEALQKRVADDRVEFEKRFAEQERIVSVVNEMIPPLEKALNDAERRAAEAEARAAQATSGAP